MFRKIEGTDGKTITVHIVSPDKTTIKKIIKNQFKDSRFFWIYLGMEVPFDLYLRGLIDQKGERISIATDIQSAAHEFRDDYIRLTGELMPDNDLQSWWLSIISEKNPFTLNLLLEFCYISSCLKLIQTCDRDLLVVCQTRGLADALEKNLLSRGVNLKKYDNPFLRMWSRFSFYSAGLIRLVWFLLTYSTRSLLAKIFSLIKRDRKLLLNYPDEWICLHSWTDKRSFGKNTEFADIYFGDLGKTLIEKGYYVFFLVDVLPTFSYIRALNNLLKTEKRIILLEEFISPVDVAASLISVREPSLKTERGIMGGIDLSLLIDEQQRKSAFDPRIRWAHLCYRAAKKIGGQSPPDRFICTFENHIWEKMFCSGFREASDRTKVIGYAHTIVNRMYTNYTISSKERDVAPLPDRIIVNGKSAADILIASGFDPATVIIGGSLRYSHLMKARDHVSHTGTIKKVIVTTSAEQNESLELIYSTLQVFSKRKDFVVIIKCHPTVPFTHVARSLPILPDNFSVSEKPLDNLLLSADLVLYTSSASAVEAFALGVPILHVKSEYRIDMNIFENIEYIPSITSREFVDIENVFSKIKVKEGDITSQKREEIVRALLSPPVDTSVSRFVSDL